MYEKILVPLDGSKIGEAALPHVEDLVSKISPGAKVEVILFQVLSRVTHAIAAGEVTANVPYTEQELEQAKQRAIDYLNETGEALRSKGATVTAKVVIGNAADEIVKAADEINANLIAMSTHGRSGLSRWAFGSITDRVLRHEESVPILMVRAPRTAEKASE